MQVLLSEIPALTSLFRKQSENGSQFVTAPENGAVTAHDLHFYESASDLTQHFVREPLGSYTTYGVPEVLKALDLLAANQDVRNEFTISTQKDPLLNIREIVIIFNKQLELSSWLLNMEECINVLSATMTGKRIGREVWEKHASHLIPLPKEFSDPRHKTKQRVVHTPGKQRGKRP